MKGMIVYSFAWRRVGQSPCNVRLAVAAHRIASQQHEPVTIVAQRTVYDILNGLRFPCLPIEKRSGYEGSEAVTEQADAIFRRLGIREVIPVAQPVFQLTKCLRLVRTAGYKTPDFWDLAHRIGWIGFDPQSVQPATRDPFSLLYYTARQILTGYRPPVEQSEP